MTEHPRMTAKTGTGENIGMSGLVRAALLCALTAGALFLAGPMHAEPTHTSAPALAPAHAKRCPTGTYWEPRNRVCVPMSPPVAWH
ncbi:hypothetical protein OIE63_36505 [Streptomyces sp. NBC_01795]|uniref:hypothetical protein n=1 Tax=Streptomyces sp. NBC_01795 TaxID=2975943 RepID=UPI002DD9D20D|nr:hypothetical protein [Streptomyces sp. NBC_01795]WSA96456.1 hypothetical protein OIE63_36505 [Streptomyces sp. NBC_01795]